MLKVVRTPPFPHGDDCFFDAYSRQQMPTGYLQRPGHDFDDQQAITVKPPHSLYTHS